MTGARLAAVLFLALPVGIDIEPSGGKRPGSASTPVPAPADGFAATVRPVLLARCAPCHEPGGSMYARLPFDRSQTIAAHQPGVLKRLKGADREAVEKWLATLPASSK